MGTPKKLPTLEGFINEAKKSQIETDIGGIVYSWFFSKGGNEKSYDRMLADKKSVADIMKVVKREFNRLQKEEEKDGFSRDYYGLSRPYNYHKDSFEKWINFGLADAKVRVKLDKMGFGNRRPKIHKSEQHAKNRAKKDGKDVFKVKKDEYWVVSKKDSPSMEKAKYIKIKI